MRKSSAIKPEYIAEATRIVDKFCLREEEREGEIQRLAADLQRNVEAAQAAAEAYRAASANRIDPYPVLDDAERIMENERASGRRDIESARLQADEAHKREAQGLPVEETPEFVWIKETVLYDRRISDVAKILYMGLKIAYARKAPRRLEMILQITNAQEEGAQEALLELVHAGYVTLDKDGFIRDLEVMS